MKTKMNAVVMALAIVALSLLAASCAQPASTAPAKYALVIGISDYLYNDNFHLIDLTYPAVDADSIHDLLRSQGWIVTDQALKDSSATKNAIKQAIEDFFVGIPSNSTALIYYSGHGTEVSGTAYLIPSDFRYDLFAPLISPTELNDWISEYIPTKNVIFISDSCYSGGFVPSGDSADSIASPYNSQSGNAISVSSLAALSDFGTLLVKNAEATGALVPVSISAAGDSEFSYETSKLGATTINHGVFTYYLLKSATLGDSNGDGYVTCTEAYSYVANSVNSKWNTIYVNNAFYPHISGGLRDLVLFDNN